MLPGARKAWHFTGRTARMSLRQGPTKEEARESVAAAITLILDDRREDGLRAVPPDAERETVTIE
jgi:predicted RNase H-like HicB family nuclease